MPTPPLTEQIARPMADDFVGNWAPTPLFPHLNHETPNDGSPVSTTATQGDAFQVKLSAVAYPAPGDQKPTVRLAEVGEGGVAVTVLLLQEDVGVITTKRTVPGPSFSDLDVYLTDAEKALITNYSRLHVQVMLDVVVPCCQGVALPPVLFATILGCGCLEGSYRLVWDGVAWKWFGTLCGKKAELAFACGHPQVAFVVSCDNVGSLGSNTVITCSPFLIIFPAVPVNNPCCNGTIDVTITQ